jgi:nucleoside-diphosphate-sugar epimerase
MAIDESGQITYTITFGRSTSLGRSLVSALLSSSTHSLIRILDPLEATEPRAPAPAFFDRISFHRADFSDRTQLIGSLSGSSVVFHVDPSRRVQSECFGRIHSLAVGFTKALISACPEAGVRRLVYTGSSDVVIGGGGDICNADESLAYPDKVLLLLSYFVYYMFTKLKSSRTM